MNKTTDLYYPSRWSKRLSRYEIEAAHINFINNESERVRTEIQCELNIPYGAGERQKIDIFGTDLCDESPIFVFIHGGYWQEPKLNRFNYEFIAKNLYKNSIKTIFIGYNLCPNVKLPEIINEIQVAAQYCLKYAKNKNSKGLYFCGHSAGGHLVTTLFTDNNFITTLNDDEKILIKAAISISGVFDLVPLLNSDVNDLLQLDKVTAEQCSPLRQQLSNGVGTIFYLIVGEEESPWFLEQSKEFCEKITNMGYCGHYWALPNVDHFNIIECLNDIDFQLTKYIIGIIN